MTISHLAATFVPESYDISIDMQRARERQFAGTVVMRGVLQAGTVIPVHATDLTIQSVTINGHAASWTQAANDELRLTYDGLVPGEYTVVIGYTGTITDAMHGLYPCYYEHDGQKKELFATQCESHHAREIFPCIDEPAAKAVFTLTLTTQPGLTVLGNMPVDWVRDGHGVSVTKFLPTPRMSSYLLAFVVGELHRQTARTKSGVEVNVWATPAQQADSLQFALEVATRSIEFFDDYFGVPYPLPKADHVALPDFSSGAMENWGLITYRESCLLADDNTPEASRRFIATVIAHELSHQWFGNLVTMQWWDDLWLNESFANMMEYVAIDALYPEWRIWEVFAAQDVTAALRRDSLDGVQPVQCAVQHPDEINTLFDPAIVYAKGARLLVMVRQLIGEAAFRAGLKAYFEQFAYGNTVGDDLWQALEAASGKSIVQLMNVWISQPGLPVVQVVLGGDGLQLSQQRFFIGDHQASDAVWPIPLFAGDMLPEMLTQQQTSLPAVDEVWLNRGMHGHFVTHYDERSRQRLLDRLARSDMTTLDIMCLLQDASLLTRAGLQSSATLLPLALSLKSAGNEKVYDMAAGLLSGLRVFVDDDTAARRHLKQVSAAFARPTMAALGWDAVPGESDDDRERRSTALALLLYGEDEAALAEAKRRFMAQGMANLPVELRSLIASAVVRHYETPDMIEQLLSLYITTPSSDLQHDIALALTSTQSAATTRRLLGAMKYGAMIRPQDVSRWFVYLIRTRESRAVAWQWLKDEWGWIKETFSGDKSYDEFLRYAATALLTQAELDDFIAFTAPLRDEPALTRTIDMGVTEIAARVALVARDGAAVRQAITDAADQLV
ncbi:MAG: M1 family metallopeptidase [Candidatus Saccharibacteria bacterium]|nr:M1 family metallopeptidase [Candidatus Saccharibacteria bacterium]